MGRYLYPSFFVKVPNATTVKIFLCQRGLLCYVHKDNLWWERSKKAQNSLCGLKGTKLFFFLFCVSIPMTYYKWQLLFSRLWESLVQYFVCWSYISQWPILKPRITLGFVLSFLIFVSNSILTHSFDLFKIKHKLHQYSSLIIKL